MTKAENYLSDRLSMLSDEKVIIITKINNLEIEIEEINEKIKEISNDMDNTFEIFSPRVKKNDFIRDEIEKLKATKNELETQINSLNEQSSLVDDDIYLIKDALGETQLSDDEFDRVKDEFKNSHKKSLIGKDILEMQENERQRIARDLHDSTVQVLANLVHKCEICSKVVDVDPVRAKLELEIMSKTLKETISDMRNIIYNLRPMSLEDLGFDTAISKIVNHIKEKTEMEVNLQILGEAFEVDSVVAITLIRIIEEASSNSIKYSNGKVLDIKLEYKQSAIHLEIIDDGDGYMLDEILKPEDNNYKGFGLAMMKERVLLLSGEINIDSKINLGTKIIIDIPIL